ncbi:MAG: class I SAM-dependent methyltransferase [Cyclobacteriaceae bacterium]|nr:class I SAM-dependent methyltransferase [Cyclobacteriaceae bacterium]
MVHQVTSFLNYWLNEVNAHSLQSPFIYSLYTTCIRKDSNKNEFKEIEQTRNRLLHSEMLVKPIDWGAPSTVHSNSSNVRVSAIAKQGLTKPKISRLLNRLIQYSNSKHIVELGTSFGLNTLYMAQSEEVKVTTFEGSKEIADIALTNFEFFKKSNIKLVEGNIDETLPKFIDSRIHIDFAYIDANHRFEPTINYFKLLLKRTHDNSIMVFDDIYWSKEMTQAWNTIKEHPQVTLSIDLFDVGIVLFKPDLSKTHYTLMF